MPAFPGRRHAVRALVALLALGPCLVVIVATGGLSSCAASAGAPAPSQASAPDAIPEPPHKFHGDVTIDGTPEDTATAPPRATPGGTPTVVPPALRGYFPMVLI